MSQKEVLSYIDSHGEKFVKDLMVLCRQASVSDNNLETRECAQLVDRMMREVGLETVILEEQEGNPVVVGDLISTSEGKRLGFYNHYDTVPPGVLELWKSAPFDPVVRNDRIFARGVGDNKGNLVARLKALEAILETGQKPSANLRFVAEGEEEIMSPNLDSLVEKHHQQIEADSYIWESGHVDEENRPVITLGVKGILSVEFEASGANKEVHSGYAPLVVNPAWRIVWALSSIKGSDERVSIEGWYDDVRELSKEEISLVERKPFDEESFKEKLGLKQLLAGVSGFEARSKLAFEPTANIYCLDAGYKGRKKHVGILPNTAFAKVDFRMVEDQDPEALFERLRKHLTEKGFGDVKVTKIASYGPAMTSPTDPFVGLVAQTAREIYGKEPVLNPPPGGSSPIAVFRKWIGKVPCVSTGVEYPDSNTHSPNENIRISDYIQGIKHIAMIMMSYK